MSDDSTTTLGNQPLDRLRLAAPLEQAGKCHDAREALRELWPSLNSPPLLDGLAPETAAQLLHRAGSLADALRGEEPSLADASEELLSLSLSIYEELDDPAAAS